MYAVFNTFEKNEVKDEITYTLVKGEDIPKYLKNAPINVLSSEWDGKHTEVWFFDTLEEAEKCMGSK